MAYGSLARVKAKKKITDTTNDTEITDILGDISDLFDFYLDGHEDTPVIDTTRLKALNYAANVIAQAEFELRHGKRNNEIGAFAVFNYGWAIFDKYLRKVHGIEDTKALSAKVVITTPTWRHVQTRLLVLKHALHLDS